MAARRRERRHEVKPISCAALEEPTAWKTPQARGRQPESLCSPRPRRPPAPGSAAPDQPRGPLAELLLSSRTRASPPGWLRPLCSIGLQQQFVPPSFAFLCATEISNVSNLRYLPAANVQALFSFLFKKQNLILDSQERQLPVFTALTTCHPEAGQALWTEGTRQAETSKPQKSELEDPSPFKTPPDAVQGGRPLTHHLC